MIERCPVTGSKSLGALLRVKRARMVGGDLGLKSPLTRMSRCISPLRFPAWACPPAVTYPRSCHGESRHAERRHAEPCHGWQVAMCNAGRARACSQLPREDRNAGILSAIALGSRGYWLLSGRGERTDCGLRLCGYGVGL